jgi:hypothetical protein
MTVCGNWKKKKNAHVRTVQMEADLLLKIFRFLTDEDNCRSQYTFLYIRIPPLNNFWFIVIPIIFAGTVHTNFLQKKITSGWLFTVYRRQSPAVLNFTCFNLQIHGSHVIMKGLALIITLYSIIHNWQAHEKDLSLTNNYVTQGEISSQSMAKTDPSFP